MTKIKRAYEPAEKSDGFRVFVDKLWPRGIKKADLVFDDWAKELTPSAELRRSFGHDPKNWKDFKSRYQFELRSKEALQKIKTLANRSRRSTVTLVYAARDPEHNHALVLKQAIDRAARRSTDSEMTRRKAA